MEESFQKVTNGNQHEKGKEAEQPDNFALKMAVQKWVKEFNCIPMSIVITLIDAGDDITEITPPYEDVEYDSRLPIWGCMWSFDNIADNWWLENKENLQAMADCGIRIFEQRDYGFIFGIDGGGYDFYEAHWIPLYKARGLRWHI